MFSKSWEKYALQTQSETGLFSTSSDLFTFPTLMDTFGSNLETINAYSKIAADNVYAIAQNKQLEKLFLDTDYVAFFNNTKFFNTNHSQLAFFESIASDIERLSVAKNDVDLMIQVFPDYEDLLCELDMWHRYFEESFQYVDSTPDVKLYYPEPFIASPSFVHEEVWFIHILHYQHWLWFMFISLVMFYFITFINVVRWCNLRTKPKRETRGVSRSKCADLITACVPVSWAASIIISETVDATDYYDGFGTGEIVIGIRAYQWGWEYFYPKGIDLSYNVKPSYSTMVGNSVKYNNSSSSNIESNSIWKSYQNKSLQSLTNCPSHVLISPSAKSSSLNLTNFSKLGLSTLKDSSAFKKIQYHSKANPQALFNSSDSFAAQYSKIHKLYSNTNNFNDSYNYGTLRQHGYSSANSVNSSVGLESNSISKLMSYNFGVRSDQSELKYANALSLPTSANNSFYMGAVLGSNGSLDVLNHRADSSLSNKNVSLTTDAKYVSNPFKYLLHTNPKSKNGELLTHKPNIGADMVKYNSSSPAINSTNTSSSFKFKDMKSGNLSFLSSDKNVRNLDQVSLSKSNINFMSDNNNLSSIISSTINKGASSSELNLYSNSSNNWANSDIVNTLLSSDTSLTPSHTPIYSNNPNWSDKGFDRTQAGQDDLGPALLKSKEETAPSYLFSSYWTTFWANSKAVHRFDNMVSNSKFTSSFYLPSINDYADYDFKNWASLEMLEDAFWESTFSSFSQDEYLNVLQDSKEYAIFKKQEELFNLTTRLKKFKNATFYKPYTKSLFIDNSVMNSLPVYTDDVVMPSNLTSLNKFSSVSLESSIDLMDESLDSSKYFRYLQFNNYKHVTNIATNGLSPYSYTTVLDPFRADYEDCVWSYDNVDSSSDNYEQEFTNQDIKSSNSMKLRSTAKNSTVTYNAIQKVFKSRLDEGRSHSRLQDFSNSFVSHPFVSAPKSPYEGMLGKNKESFFSPQSYNQLNSNNFNTLFSVWNSLNSTFLDIPFLISATSDPSRYLWFDWKSRWSSMEVQPSSVARYSLSGVPYFNKSYEFDTQKGDDLNESENYINRLARARKNYMPNWAHTPYFYARTSNWYKLNSNLVNSYNNLGSTKLLLNESKSYWTSTTLQSSTSSNFTPSISGVNTPAKASWRPLSGIQGYYSDSSILVDILTKREVLYRSYFNSKGYTANLPVYLTASPENNLLLEVQKGYSLVDPVSFSSELTRELTYQDLNFMRFTLLRDLVSSLNTTVNTSALSNYLFYYLTGSSYFNNSNLGSNQELYKNQYRPLKKGITNMIRLHTTGAVAMPIEIRLHILASSRDVIHSWAIPSAGIKIDCVPGYSSHRVTIFLVSGIFWGQCMEICGRFHHWMPIVVYFMKRDLFFLWCTHFMHYSSATEMLDATDRQLADKLRLASFDQTSWVNEINKIF